MLAEQAQRDPAMRANLLATISTHQVYQQLLETQIPDLRHKLEVSELDAVTVQHNLQLLVTALGDVPGVN